MRIKAQAREESDGKNGGVKGEKGGAHADEASDNEMNEAYLGSVRVRIIQVL